MSSQTRAEDRFDLSRWRIAGNGADMIRPDVMQAFVDCFDDGRLQGQRLLPELRPRRSDARRLADAAGRRHPARAGRGERAVRRRRRTRTSARAATARWSIAASRSPAWRSRSAGPTAKSLPDRGIGKVYVRGASVMHSYFRDEESTRACLSADGWLDTGDMGYMSSGYIFIVGRAKDMIIINGRNHWPQDIEWAVEQLPGFKSGDIAAFAITGPSGEETPAVLVHCRVSGHRGARPPARRNPRARPRDHRHHAGGRAGPAAHPAPHQLGQAVARPRPATSICPAKSSPTTSPPDGAKNRPPYSFLKSPRR